MNTKYKLRDLFLSVFNNLSRKETICFYSNTKIEAQNIVASLKPVIRLKKPLEKYLKKDANLYKFEIKTGEVFEIDSEKLFKAILDYEIEEKTDYLWQEDKQRDFFKGFIANKYNEERRDNLTISEEELGLNKNNIALFKVFDYLVKQTFIEREVSMDTASFNYNFYFIYKNNPFETERIWITPPKPIFLRISFKIKNLSLFAPYYQESNNKPQKIIPNNSECKAFCEGKNGFFQFNKHSKRIPIGKNNTRTYKLLNTMSEPYFGIKKTIDTIFESIKIDKDKTNSALNNGYLSNKEKIKIIKNTIKELQKIDGVRGKLNYIFENSDRELRLDLK